SPLIGGCSLGGLIGQLVAASTPTRGLFCLAPAPVAGIRGPLSALRVFGHHFLQGAPWRKPLRPPTWKAFRRVEAAAQDEATAREMHSGHGLFESGRAYCEIVFPFLDRGHATRVDHSAVSVPVLVVGGTRDRLTSPRVCRQTAARYSRGEYAEIEGADHMLTGGKHLPTVMEHLDRWIHVNRLAHDGAHP
ncbi:MAG TPA: alpha/beta fold hydrolase, partial [Mycobacterium sp.]|nr:alpha/beta fold hydrolase [Mycobacterium sp.]